LLIYSGCGWLVLVVAVGSFIGSQHIAEQITGDPRYYATHDAPKCAALLASALILWLLSRVATGDPEKGVHHSFFFVPLSWWPPALAFGAALQWLF
jgi:hypothetical protein